MLENILSFNVKRILTPFCTFTDDLEGRRILRPHFRIKKLFPFFPSSPPEIPHTLLNFENKAEFQHSQCNF